MYPLLVLEWTLFEVGCLAGWLAMGFFVFFRICLLEFTLSLLAVLTWDSSSLPFESFAFFFLGFSSPETMPKSGGVLSTDFCFFDSLPCAPVRCFFRLELQQDWPSEWPPSESLALSLRPPIADKNNCDCAPHSCDYGVLPCALRLYQPKCSAGLGHAQCVGKLGGGDLLCGTQISSDGEAHLGWQRR